MRVLLEIDLNNVMMKIHFSLMNFIDFMAILPVFLTMILEGLEDMRVGQSICALLYLDKISITLLCR